METRVRTDRVSVYSNVCVHDGIELVLSYGDKDGDSAKILVGQQEEVMLEFTDVASLERFAAMAAEGAAGLTQRIEASRRELAEERAAYSHGGPVTR
jgi:hypothetical protein